MGHLYVKKLEIHFFVKIRALWPRSLLHRKNPCSPFGLNISPPQVVVYCMQKNWLCNTVPMQQTINWDILKRSAQIWRFGLVQLILACFLGYLGPMNKTLASSSRSARVWYFHFEKVLHEVELKANIKKPLLGFNFWKGKAQAKLTFWTFIELLKMIQ